MGGALARERFQALQNSRPLFGDDSGRCKEAPERNPRAAKRNCCSSTARTRDLSTTRDCSLFAVLPAEVEGLDHWHNRAEDQNSPYSAIRRSAVSEDLPR